MKIKFNDGKELTGFKQFQATYFCEKDDLSQNSLTISFDDSVAVEDIVEIISGADLSVVTVVANTGEEVYMGYTYPLISKTYTATGIIVTVVLRKPFENPDVE